MIWTAPSPTGIEIAGALFEGIGHGGLTSVPPGEPAAKRGEERSTCWGSPSTTGETPPSAPSAPAMRVTAVQARSTELASGPMTSPWSTPDRVSPAAARTAGSFRSAMQLVRAATRSSRSSAPRTRATASPVTGKDPTVERSATAGDELAPVRGRQVTSRKLGERATSTSLGAGLRGNLSVVRAPAGESRCRGVHQVTNSPLFEQRAIRALEEAWL